MEMILANVQQPGPLPACVGVVAGSSLQPQVMWPRTRSNSWLSL